MWVARLFFLVVLLSLAALLGAALSTADLHAPAHQQALGQGLVSEARWLSTRVDLDVSAQVLLAERRAADPRLQEALLRSSVSLPDHVMQALFEPVLRGFDEAHPGHGWILVDTSERVIARFGAETPGPLPIAEPPGDPRGAGPMKQGTRAVYATWVTVPTPAPEPTLPDAAPVAPPPSLRLVVTGAEPSAQLARHHAASPNSPELVMVKATGATGATEATVGLLAQLTRLPTEGFSAIPCGASTCLAARRPLLRDPASTFALVSGPLPDSDLAAIGGIGAILARVQRADDLTLGLVVASVLAWAIGLGLWSLALGRSVSRLARALSQATDELPQAASRYPAFLRPVVLAANEAVAELLRRKSEPVTVRAVEIPADRVQPAPTPPPLPASAPVELFAAPQSNHRPARKPGMGGPPEMDRDDGEPDTQNDGHFRPASVGGSLLARLREEQGLASDGPREGPHENTAVRPVPVEFLSAMRHEAGREVTGIAKTPKAVSEKDEAYFEAVYRDFLKLRRACGEVLDPTDDRREYRRFRNKLMFTREQLIERFGCRDVRFRVYTKDGKAALKASPVLDDDA